MLSHHHKNANKGMVAIRRSGGTWSKVIWFYGHEKR
jgi:hypothetical protein